MMNRLPAAPRLPRAASEEMTLLEYAMATAFVLTSLVVAVPAVSASLRSAARLLLAPFA
jgi:hypothetical protein